MEYTEILAIQRLKELEARVEGLARTVGGVTAWRAAGSGSPEGSVIGECLGMLYIDTATADIYVFLGTPGTNTGWA